MATLDIEDVGEVAGDDVCELQQAVGGIEPWEKEVQLGLQLLGEEGQRWRSKWFGGQRLRVRGARVHHPQGGLPHSQQEGEFIIQFIFTSHHI